MAVYNGDHSTRFDKCEYRLFGIEFIYHKSISIHHSVQFGLWSFSMLAEICGLRNSGSFWFTREWYLLGERVLITHARCVTRSRSLSSNGQIGRICTFVHACKETCSAENRVFAKPLLLVNCHFIYIK